MQGDFEKEVRKKMEELQLTPSAPVWEKVELEIRPDKKRRRGWFWIPFIIVFVGANGWWMWATQKDSVTAKEASPVTIDNVEAKNVPTTATATPQNENGSSIDNKKEVLLTSEGRRKEGTIVKERTALHTNDKVKQRSAFYKQPPVLQRYGTQVDKFKLEKAVTAETKENGEASTASSGEEKQGVEKNTPTESTINTPVADTTQSNTAAEKKEEALIQKDSAQQKTKNKPAAKPLKIAAVFRGGWSDPSRTGASLVMADANYSTPPPGTSNGNAGRVDAGPSAVTTGTSFSAGVAVIKPLFQRLTVSAGLQYAYYGTQTKVGEFKTIDTAIQSANKNLALQGYYTNPGQNKNEYTNQYHLLEIPVTVQYQLFTKLPLLVSAGASYGRLISTNALTYNSGGFYYENKDVVNKNYTALFSSLEFRIGKPTGLTVTAGPVVQWHLSPLQKNGGNTSSKLFFTGLKSTIIF